MSEKEIHPRDPAQLRRRAAEMARREAALAPKNIDGLTHGESLRKLHELRVHQIELEMQNEELLRTQVELDAARAGYLRRPHSPRPKLLCGGGGVGGVGWGGWGGGGGGPGARVGTPPPAAPKANQCAGW